MHIYALNYIWQRSIEYSKDEHMKSSPVFAHTMLYCLAYCSVLIICHDDFASDCCASGTSSAIYIWEQHKIITVRLPVSQGHGSSSTQLWELWTCSSVYFYGKSVTNTMQCYTKNYIFFICCVFLSFSWFNLSKLAWFGLYINKNQVLAE